MLVYFPIVFITVNCLESFWYMNVRCILSLVTGTYTMFNVYMYVHVVLTKHAI